jgi:hypothetical protein
VQRLCRVLEVAPNGYYEWLQQPVSNRAMKDARLLRLIRASFTASQGICGARRVFLDLRAPDAAETARQSRPGAAVGADASSRALAVDRVEAEEVPAEPAGFTLWKFVAISSIDLLKKRTLNVLSWSAGDYYCSPDFWSSWPATSAMTSAIKSH